VGYALERPFRASYAICTSALLITKMVTLAEGYGRQWWLPQVKTNAVGVLEMYVSWLIFATEG